MSLNKYLIPHVNRGYRPKYDTIDTLKSVFEIHNETINIWTSLLPLIYIFIQFFQKVDITKLFIDNFFEKHQFILIFGNISGLSATIASTWTHTFHTSDIKFRYPWMVDFIGISNALFLAGVASIWYVFDEITIVKYLYLLTTSIIYYKNIRKGITNHIKHCDDVRSYPIVNFPEFRKTFCMTIIYGWIIPWTYGYLYGNEFESKVFANLFYAPLSLIIGAFFLITQLPEKLYPGRFDIIGQSHQLWHIGAGYCTLTCCYYGIELFNNF